MSEPTPEELQKQFQEKMQSLTPEQLAEIRVQQQEQLVANLAPLVRAYAPAAMEDGEVIAITRKAVQDQEVFGQVVAAGADREARTTHPFWGYHLKKGEETIGTIWVTKRFPKEDGNANLYGSLLGYAMSPGARAIMMTQGYYFEFFQADGKPKATPKIHLPS